MKIDIPHLNERELQILDLRRKRVPWKTIAETHNVSYARARMIHQDALRKIVHAILRAYLEEHTPA